MCPYRTHESYSYTMKRSCESCRSPMRVPFHNMTSATLFPRSGTRFLPRVCLVCDVAMTLIATPGPIVCSPTTRFDPQRAASPRMKLSIALALASAGSALALVARQVSTVRLIYAREAICFVFSQPSSSSLQLPTTVHLVPTLASWTTSTSGLIANGHWAVAPPAEYTVLPIVSETDVTSGKFYLQTSAGACYASISAPLFCSPVDIVPRAAFRLVRLGAFPGVSK